jgi:hypothetical protein
VALGLAVAEVSGAPPSAKQILNSVRMLESRQQIELDGQLRQDDIVIPFHLSQAGPIIRYSFSNPDETLQLRLEENGSRLELVGNEGAEKFPADKLKDKIRGTGISYDDLALRFLYWPNAKVLGDETVRTRSCWKLQVVAPSRDAQYWNVVVWVDKASGALMRMEAYDWNGKLAKRFEVISAQKIEDRWFLKQMRVEEMEPGSDKVTARTYLEIKK